MFMNQIMLTLLRQRNKPALEGRIWLRKRRMATIADRGRTSKVCTTTNRVSALGLSMFKKFVFIVTL